MNLPRDMGSFEILEPLGAGGMGEVFKARDKRLNRFVAIKFLPQAASTSARERFQREALAIAALNHPNICTLYDSGEDQRQPYLVMELLEGETLYTRLQRGPVSVAQLAQWGVEIADALEAAHAKGILHRDLKPGNIFITGRGAVKVLDFGLAQFALSAAAADSEAPTITTPGPGPAMGPLTAPGTTMGTYAYMSPEQARGEATDARSDIFSLGVVLYEMAGGRAPFKGRTTADLTAQILMLTPPAPSTLRPEVPARLDDIIAQCLEKDPGMRFQSAKELHVSLRRLLSPSSSPGSASSAAAAAAVLPPPRAKTKSRPWLWPVVAAVIIAAGIASWFKLRAPAPPPELQLRQLTYSGHVVDAVISPDGKFLAHVDNSPQGTSLHLLSITSGSDVQIVPPGNGCCQSPSFAPDGSQVYFLQNRVLKAVPVLGGEVRVIAPLACSGAGFSPDGRQIAFETTDNSERLLLMLARSDGSALRQLSTAPADAGYTSQCWGGGAPTHAPAWSPDGSRIAVAQTNTAGVGHVTLINAQNGGTRPLGPDVGWRATDLSWLPDGSGLVFTASLPATAVSQLWEMSVPGGRLTRLTNDLQGYSSASLADTGALVLTHAAPTASLWVQQKPDGAFAQLPGGGADGDGAVGVCWTPAGELISTRIFGSKTQLWAEASDGGSAHALNLSGAPDVVASPQAAPNGQIVFEAGNGNDASIWRANSDGSGLMELVSSGSSEQPVLVDGGSGVAYWFGGGQAGNQALWEVPLAGGKPLPLWPHFIYSDGNPASPDGSKIFLVTRRQGTADGHAPVILTLSGGKIAAVTPLPLVFTLSMRPLGWTADGKAVTYLMHQGTVDNIWALPLAGGKPYAITHFTDLLINAYAFSQDGRLAVSRGANNSDAVLVTGLAGRTR